MHRDIAVAAALRQSRRHTRSGAIGQCNLDAIGILPDQQKALAIECRDGRLETLAPAEGKFLEYIRRTAFHRQITPWRTGTVVFPDQRRVIPRDCQTVAAGSVEMMEYAGPGGGNFDHLRRAGSRQRRTQQHRGQPRGGEPHGLLPRNSSKVCF